MRPSGAKVNPAGQASPVAIGVTPMAAGWAGARAVAGWGSTANVRAATKAAAANPLLMSLHSSQHGRAPGNDRSILPRFGSLLYPTAGGPLYGGCPQPKIH